MPSKTRHSWSPEVSENLEQPLQENTKINAETSSLVNLVLYISRNVIRRLNVNWSILINQVESKGTIKT